MLPELLEDRYRIEHPLGQGGMGVVYSARQLRVDRPVAIKVLRQDRWADAAAYRRFIEEARACSAVRHPNVVTIHDFGQTPDGLLYLVMELVDGHPMSVELRAAVPMGRAIGLAEQLCAGLQATHRSGTVHGDLKPSNLLVCEREGIGPLLKIVDFGLARAVGSRTQRLQGTPRYISPEQIRGARIDERADLYAVGVIMYELFSGQAPFQGEQQELLEQHLLAEPPPLAAVIPEGLRSLIAACLAKDPAERPQNAGLIQNALARVRQEHRAAPVGLLGPTAAMDPNTAPFDQTVDAPSVRSSADRSLFESGGLVGRQDTLSLVQASLFDGAGGMRVLVGPSGAGKSRMLQEIRRLVLGRGWLLLSCRLQPAHAGVPFVAVELLLGSLEAALSLSIVDAEQLRTQLIQDVGPVGALLRPFSPALASMLVDSPELPPVPDDHAQARGFAALDRLVRSLADVTEGLCLVLDDLQWCDAASVAWLHRLEPQLRALPIQVVAASTQPGLGGTLTVPIGPMAPAELAALIVSELGPVSEEVVEALSSLSGGLPGPLLALLSRACAAGVFALDDGMWLADPRALAALSGSTGELDALPAATQAALEAAAVWGIQASIETLQQLIVPPSPGAVRAAARARLLRRRKSAWELADPSLRAAILERIPPARLARLHRRAVELLIAQSGAPGRLFRIGNHLLQAGPAQPGDLAWLRRAALAAMDAQDGEGAIRFADAAVARLDEAAPDRLRLELDELLARALVAGGQRDAARARYLACLAREGVDPTLRLEMIRALSNLFIGQGSARDALVLQEEALLGAGWVAPRGRLGRLTRLIRYGFTEIAQERPPGDVVGNIQLRNRTRLLAQRVGTLLLLEPPAALQSALEALADARRGGFGPEMSVMLSLLSLLSMRGLGWLGRARRLSERSAALCGDDEVARTMSRVVRVALHEASGEFQPARQKAADLQGDLYRLGQPMLTILAESTLGLVSLAQGDLDSLVQVDQRLQSFFAGSTDSTCWRTAMWGAAGLECGEDELVAERLGALLSADGVSQAPALRLRLRHVHGLASLQREGVQPIADVFDALARGRDTRWFHSVAVSRAAHIIASRLSHGQLPASTKPHARRLLKRLLRRHRLCRPYPVHRLSLALAGVRLALHDGQLSRARRQLARLAPITSQLADHGALIAAHALVLRAGLEGGPATPLGVQLQQRAITLLEQVDGAFAIHEQLQHARPSRDFRTLLLPPEIR